MRMLALRDFCLSAPLAYLPHLHLLTRLPLVRKNAAQKAQLARERIAQDGRRASDCRLRAAWSKINRSAWSGVE